MRALRSYTWRKQLFEGALSLFSPGSNGDAGQKRKIKELEETLRLRDSALGDLISENIALKKSFRGGA